MLWWLRTRHCENWSPLTDQVDPSRSPYAEKHPRYLQLHRCLSDHVRTDQFLWCMEASDSRMDLHEIRKPAEWLVTVDETRILGFVDARAWDKCFRGERDFRGDEVFFTEKPERPAIDILVNCPLRDGEPVSKRVFKAHPGLKTADTLSLSCFMTHRCWQGREVEPERIIGASGLVVNADWKVLLQESGFDVSHPIECARHVGVLTFSRPSAQSECNSE